MIASARIELAARRGLDSPAYAVQAMGEYAWIRETCAHKARVWALDTDTVVGIVAAMSPQIRWHDQACWLPQVLEALEKGKPIPGPGFPANKAKAIRIHAGESPKAVLVGNQVQAFYWSILGKLTHVCIARADFELAHGDRTPRTLTDKRYRETVAAYWAAADRLKLVFPDLAKKLTPVAVKLVAGAWWKDNPGDRF